MHWEQLSAITEDLQHLSISILRGTHDLITAAKQENCAPRKLSSGSILGSVRWWQWLLALMALMLALLTVTLSRGNNKAKVN